jgi:hypothetical protein
MNRADMKAIYYSFNRSDAKKKSGPNRADVSCVCFELTANRADISCVCLGRCEGDLLFI